MSQRRKKIGTCIVLMLAGISHSIHAVTPAVPASSNTNASTDSIRVIISFKNKLDVRPFAAINSATARKREMVTTLRKRANATQWRTGAFLRKKGIWQQEQLWLNNEMAATIPVSALQTLQSFPEVAHIRMDELLAAPVITQSTPTTPEWNLSLLHAPDLWAKGYTGKGVVVANMDTGVDAQHPDLNAAWRGGTNSWYDPHGEHALPHDAHGHGTQTMGVMVGGSAGGTAIGIAPGARWIAAKIYNDAGFAFYSNIHQSFQWFLDPDNDPNTQDAPDIVNASWALSATKGQCITEFERDIQVLKTAGIAVVFAAGNDGPDDATSNSPANNPSSFSSGAIDSSLALAAFSSRGPSACNASIFPVATAPGVAITTSDLSFGGLPLYASVSGTSYAAPHIAGAMALLVQAFPNLDVKTLEQTITMSAHDLGVVGADNLFGNGLVDVLAAYNALAQENKAPIITSTPVSSAIEDARYTYQVTATDPESSHVNFSLSVSPVGMNILSDTGLITWTPTNNQVGTHTVTVKASDPQGLAAMQTFTLSVSNVNDLPVAANDAYTIGASGLLNVGTPGVLRNDKDIDGDAMSVVLIAKPINGALTFNANGSFSYKPNVGFTGTDKFTYRCKDRVLFSNIATVKVTVVANKPPIAANDAATTRRNTAVIIKVLANDRDAEGKLNLKTVTIVEKPFNGGIVSVRADGTIRYMPKLNFLGEDSFTYTIKDIHGAISNVAIVKVVVKL